MNYKKILDEKAKKGFEVFTNYIRDSKNLLYEVDESECGETEVEVNVFDENECTDLVGYWNFDEFGNYVM